MGWYSKHFGEDTLKWFMVLVTREIIEIIFQTLALFNYNGVNVFDTSQIVLAYRPEVITTFATLVGANAIIVGILWICYILKADYCHGLFFKQLVFVIDTIFDTCYALYPIYAVLSDLTRFNLEVAIGVLQTTNLCVMYLSVVYL